MSIISSGVSWYASEERRPSASPSVGPVPGSREEELARQLDARLSGRLTHIRAQIAAGKEADTPSPDGVGRTLDIGA